jgi:hypothetical protein
MLAKRETDSDFRLHESVAPSFARAMKKEQDRPAPLG